MELINEVTVIKRRNIPFSQSRMEFIPILDRRMIMYEEITRISSPSMHNTLLKAKSS